MATKRRIRRAMCGHKQAFTTVAQADVAAYALRKSKGEHVTPYRCRFCKQWHYGHRPRKD